MGKLLLCERPDLMPDGVSQEFLDEIETIRREGYAMNFGESEKGIVAIGIWLGTPSPLTPMLAVTWPEFRYSEVAKETALERLRKESRRFGPFSVDCDAK
ncbi:IclR family transcriptional regulator C-terminal domain-containing protein [Pelagicoccus sp. SDUM812003]|uniref:IclR family transcriptional regulator domain-containing protein n=1 Tax=Pelagicoccus sp. SDUM812003 TaxID=3041267 RepID=UPI0028102C0F|nr:IclR family transcriptional regulator C-terminal domain-containing protein [Pelagicoccus sp. SDUM812003]MDQ8201465.1 IclR family transcriptional regulator C-terminal domain-containing protein [Pelagicoccus sp. SDUM812003]